MKDILFFDTETTGLIPEIHEIAQIAWQVYDQEGIKKESQSLFLNCLIGDSEKYHGISQKVIDEFHIPHEEVFEMFFKSLDECNLVVAHNVTYDLGMIEGTIRKRSLKRFLPDVFKLLEKESICTMRAATGFCKIPSRHKHNQYKWPRLSELHIKLFNEDFTGAHNAEHDVTATAKCFFELVKKGVIKL